MRPFVHLDVHSHYSLLNALPKIPDLVKRAKEYGMPALALTDNGNLYGAIEFYKACKAEGIQPIIGLHAYVACRTRHDRQAGVDNRRYRLILLCKNLEGYKNLLKIVTVSHLEGFYYKPRVDRELLKVHRNGLIALFPTLGSETSALLKSGDLESAVKLLVEYQTMFGPDSTFLELTIHPELEGHADLVGKIKKLGQKTSAPIVAAHETYYLNFADRRARETLLLIQTNSDLSDRRDFANQEDDFSFKSSDEMAECFKEHPETLDTALRIAKLCNLELELGTWVFPNYLVENAKTYDAELRRIVMEGIKRRGLIETPELTERIEYELGVIKAKGYAPYFLVVGDLLRFAHERGILTTIRGSVAGSIVTYLAGITTVNPFEYKLPFERFLNPDRPSAPDIDMDFADNRRDEVIEYAREKYGRDKVAQIGTFGTMMARGAVRDVARALGHPYTSGDTIAKLIPMGSQGFPMTIDRALELVPELNTMYTSDQTARDIIDMARKIEGCARHISVHAAGVVIAPTALTDYVPLQNDPKGENKIITQYDMYAVEDAGLLKFDFLGIKNLAILSDAVAEVKKTYNVDVDIENIPLDDKKTFKVLAKGETVGLFQLNGSGMTKFLMDLKPSTIFDINAMVALYRPGPMESIPSYIERKHNPHLVAYLDPRLKDILDQSYGVLTYQDDVLLIAIKLAGYTWAEADKLRKAMGKKIPAEMQAQKEKLLEGFKKNGLASPKAEKMWKLIEPFAAYGFNKAHAASYGRVAYQTAYMKANFPVVYMAAVLTADAGDVEKIGEIITECRRMSIPVLPPSVNESFGSFTVVKDGGVERIRFGLISIKNFGEGVGDTIIAERETGGQFKNLADFLERIKDKNLNKKSLEALIMSGALDDFGERKAMLGSIEGLLEYAKESASSSGPSLFSALGTTNLPALRLKETPKATAEERLLWERELLGLYISGHPLDKYREKLEKHDMTISKAKNELKEGMTVVVAGLVEEAKDILTKRGERMMFLKLADFTGTIEAAVFPRVLEESKALLLPNACIALKGRFSNRNNSPSLIAEKIKLLE